MDARGQRAFAEEVIWKSFHSRLCAAVRAFSRTKKGASFSDIQAMAARLEVMKPTREAIYLEWREKDKGGFRLITKDGPVRTAQRLLVRDVLSLPGVDSSYDYSKADAGGEKALTQAVANCMVDGYRSWWTPDIKNCFASLKPGHFAWLKLDKRVLRNVVFTPKCARVRVKVPKEYGKVLSYFQMTYPDLTMSMPSLMHVSLSMVRQGRLPTGSVLSPLLARGFVGRELRACLEAEEVGFSYMDDLTIGARTSKDAKAAKERVTKFLQSHPAGPIELHDASILEAASWKVEVLGYVLQPGNGYGDNPVHIKPGRKRLSSYRVRLEAKLKAATSLDELYRIGDRYWGNWFPSQQAWTKVPEQSENVSRCAHDGYVDDFKLGCKMGQNWTKAD